MDILNILGTFVLMYLLVIIPIKWIKYGKEKHKENSKKEGDR